MNRLKVALVAASCLSWAYAGASWAQASYVTKIGDEGNSNIRLAKAVDQNSVDLSSGSLVSGQELASIGADRGLSASFIGSMFWFDISGTISEKTFGTNGPKNHVVTIGSSSVRFYRTIAGVITEMGSSTGSSLALGQAAGSFVFTDRSGAKYYFSSAAEEAVAKSYPSLSSIVRPNGEVVDYTYYQLAGGQRRVQSVKSSLGYQLNFVYNSSGNVTRVSAVNLAHEYCAPDVNAPCAPPGSWPYSQITYAADGSGSFAIADALSRSVNYTVSGGKITQVTTPEGVTETFQYDASERVQSVTRGSATWTYSYTSTDPFITTVSGPTGTRSVKTDASTGQVVEEVDEVNSRTAYELDPTTKILKKVIFPEGNFESYTYDARGNLTQTSETSKGASPTTRVIYSADYPSNCDSTNFRICNQPIVTRDARGYLAGYGTEYEYDAAHGGVLKVTKPAPASGAVRPQFRTTYQAYSPWFKNSSGVQSQAGAQIYVPTSTSTCLTQSSCLASADESKTTISYQTGSAANGSNLLPTSVTLAAGDNSAVATTAMAYTPAGDLTSIDGPLAGAADTVRRYYTAARELKLEIGPDPDGGGALFYAGRKYTYDADGRLTLVESGTATSQSDAPLTTVLAAERTQYDPLGQVYKQTTEIGGSIKSLVQYGYDSGGRQICATVRMNSAVFTSPETNACTLGTAGLLGSDRITRVAYDNVGRATSVTTGFGTGSAMTQYAATYTINGNIWTLSDGASNKTTYVYDEYDRLKRINYPLQTTGSGASNIDDYKEYAYDDSDNVVSIRPRTSSTITYTYDNLNRLKTKVVPATSTIAAATFNYGYNNVGLATSIAESSRTVTRQYDALGRLSNETEPVGTVSYLYDAASRRIRLTWPDAFFVTYEYYENGAIKAIRRAGDMSAIALIGQFTYDDLGRRKSLTRNGVITGYAYTNSLQLTDLSHDLAGSADDVTYGFTYNPAGQTRTQAVSNLAYVWSSPGSIDRSYGVNGLNQMTSAGSTPLSYGSRGNLESDGTFTFKYDLEERLRGTTSGASLTYDPASRLYQAVTVGGTSTRYLYDGLDIIGEYDGSNNLLRRYVHGQGVDEPLARFNGASTSPEWLIADQRGSVIATTNSSGTVLSDGTGKRINTYGNYGEAGVQNAGLFQYTGQASLSDLNIYYYKSRAYSPTLGRFLQPDTIGYHGGMNLYGYVYNDPINLTDPSGMDPDCDADGNNCEVDPIVVTGARAPFVVRTWRRFVGVDGDGYARKLPIRGPLTRSVEQALRCPVMQVEFVAGAVAEATATVDLVETSAQIDFASARLGYDLVNNKWSGRATQGGGLELGAGPYQIVGAKVTREATLGRAGTRKFGPWSANHDPFVGAKFGGALVLGLEVKAGYNQVKPQQSCPQG